MTEFLSKPLTFALMATVTRFFQWSNGLNNRCDGNSKERVPRTMWHFFPLNSPEFSNVAYDLTGKELGSAIIQCEEFWVAGSEIRRVGCQLFICSVVTVQKRSKVQSVSGTRFNAVELRIPDLLIPHVQKQSIVRTKGPFLLFSVFPGRWRQ